jgi:hypothetical protein
MLQFATPVTVVSPAGPRQFVRSAPPFVFAFAMGGAPTRPEPIVPGEITVIEIADGACHSSRQDDWFAARVPAIPAMTGPLRVSGVAPGDILEIEVLALEPRDVASDTLLTIAIGVAGGGVGPDRTSAIPAGGLLRIAAERPGGLVTVGPVILAHQISGERIGVPVAAFVTIRVAVAPPRGSS